MAILVKFDITTPLFAHYTIIGGKKQSTQGVVYCYFTKSVNRSLKLNSCTDQ